ncbi:MAG: hypothetical protein QOC89_5853, partial [Paraburkholderia sp.]|nr:hypothetical protein [Paraburkholderia sp.]
PAYAKKAGTECKNRAKLVPSGLVTVHHRTGMGFIAILLIE